MIDSHQIEAYFLDLQDKICEELRIAGESKAFHQEQWAHREGGGGKTRVLEKGELFERAGVNFSCVEGITLPKAASEKRPELINRRFMATGVSVVLHPHNPYVPTSHFNLRFISCFERENVCNPQKPSIWWFGGGFDLTPYYPFEEDCLHWHTMAKNACAPFGKEIYPKLKKDCDEYFYLKHRNETRGIGGLFFDDLNTWPIEHCFDFIQSIGRHYMLAYLPIVAKRKQMPYGDAERNFQLYRRGRYVEFNLIYDRGTLFGLQSGGRTESILMSLPPEVHYKYDYQPKPGSKEAELYDYLKPRIWI